MKYKTAQKELEYALKHQKTISIDKLNVILQSMNISTKKTPDDVEIKFLKDKIKLLQRNLNREKHNNRKLKKRLEVLKNE